MLPFYPEKDDCLVRIEETGQKEMVLVIEESLGVLQGSVLRCVRLNEHVDALEEGVM